VPPSEPRVEAARDSHKTHKRSQPHKHHTAEQLIAHYIPPNNQTLDIYLRELPVRVASAQAVS
jgi:hypothetical protein